MHRIDLTDDEVVEELRDDLHHRPLPRSGLLTARDIAMNFGVDVNTVYVWTCRGILTRRFGRYDWREAAIWLRVRDSGKVREPTATRPVV